MHKHSDVHTRRTRISQVCFLYISHDNLLRSPDTRPDEKKIRQAGIKQQLNWVTISPASSFVFPPMCNSQCASITYTINQPTSQRTAQ